MKTWTRWRLPTPDAESGRRASYAPGEIIAGKYELRSVLGEGGMGAVWLGRNLTLDVDVAIKLIRRDVASTETSQRLLQEARAAARLGHPAIVRVFDFGVSEHGDPFMVMEVLDGELLSEVLDRKVRLAATNAVALLLPVVSALDAAHGKGIVHRDLKPDNIVLVSDDTGSAMPKVLDFGVAKLRHEDGIDRRLTQGRTVMGTPDYMSPEQACGDAEVDGRADIWGLCVILYEAITGRRPFDGPDVRSLFTAVVSQEPTPTIDLGAGDKELWDILAGGLAKEPDARWPTMRALGVALAQWAVERGVENDVAGRSIATQWLGDWRPLSDAPVRSSGTPALERVDGGRSPDREAPPRVSVDPRARQADAEPAPSSLRAIAAVPSPAPEARIEIASESTDTGHTLEAPRRPRRRAKRWRWAVAMLAVGAVGAALGRESLYEAALAVSPAQPAPPMATRASLPPPQLPPAPPPASAEAAPASASAVVEPAPPPEPADAPSPSATAASSAPKPQSTAEAPATAQPASSPNAQPSAHAATAKPAVRSSSAFPVPAQPNF